MSYFVIVGRPLCPFSNHAKYVANFLSKKLPNFKIRVQELHLNEWLRMLKEKKMKYNWYHNESPLIWKELIAQGGKPHYIGGLSEFWEYCYDYYGLESILSKKELDKLVGDYRQYYESKKGNEDRKPTAKKTKIICITGDQIDFIALLTSNLLELDEAFGDFDVIIRIFQQTNDTMNWRYILENISDIPFTVRFSIELINNLKECLTDCDLLIVTGDYARNANEKLHKWLQRNYVSMIDLAVEINLHADRSLRLIVATNGPVCFNATILLRNITHLKLNNIVALTADVGMQVLHYTAKILDVPLKNLGAPPVWGFCGLNQIIDVDHIVELSDVYRPNLRGIKYINDTTLTVGKKYTELRYLGYRTCNVINFWTKFKENQLQFLPNPDRPTFLPKIRALTSLIDNWFSSSKDGNIISLGLATDGTFGIPSGVIFSQPVMIRKGNWERIPNFPMPSIDPCSVHDLVPLIGEVLYMFHMIYGNKIFKLRNDIYITVS